ncbi:Phosphoglycerate mutase [Entamoeba marina]
MTELVELIPQKKKILCQVPIINWERVVELVEEYKTVVIPAFYKRYDPAFQYAKDWIDESNSQDEETKDLTSLKMVMIYPGNPTIDDIEECLTVEVIHDLDLMNWLFSEIDSKILVQTVELSNNVLCVKGEILARKYGKEVPFSIEYCRKKEGMCQQMIYLNDEAFGHEWEMKKEDGSEYWDCYGNAFNLMYTDFENIDNDSLDGDFRLDSYHRSMYLLKDAVMLCGDEYLERFNAKHKSTLPLDKHIYKPFNENIVSYKDVLLKPLRDKNELKVLKYLKQTELSKFLPELHGKVEINDTTFISMSDLTKNYVNPKVLDIRIGQTCTISKMEQQPFGLRIVDSISEPKKDVYTWNELYTGIKKYLKDNKESFSRYEVLPSFVKLLHELLSIVGSTKKVAFKQMSLILVYDAIDDASQKPTIHLLDFKKTEIDEKYDVDHYFCFALNSLIKLMHSLHEHFTSRHCVFLCRHGFRLDYTDLDWVPNAKYPHDPPLSDEGVQQAKDLAKRLKHEKIDLIVSSPFYRATMTAKYIAEELGVQYVVEPAFGEFLSINNRKAVPDLDPSPRESDPAMNKNFDPLGKTLSLETWESMQELAIVSHRSTFQALLSVIVGSKFKYPLDFASITCVVPSKSTSGWVMDRLNMFSHVSVFTESPLYNPNYARKSYKDMVVDEKGGVHDS